MTNKKSPSKQRTYYGDSFSSTKPLLKVKDEKDLVRSSTSGGFGEKSSTVISVKVKMTKQEAARLLSKCKGGGVPEFRNVARELMDIPMNRVTVVSPCSAGSNSVLDSIPEDH